MCIRDTVFRNGTGPRTHSRHASTSSRCRSPGNHPGTCTAPGATTLRGRGNSPSDGSGVPRPLITPAMSAPYRQGPLEPQQPLLALQAAGVPP